MSGWRRPVLLGGMTICLAALGALLGCHKKTSKVHPIDAMETAGMLANDFAVLVDVREESELKEGMAQGARWFPTSKTSNEAEWTKFVESLPKNKQVVMYCAVGGRAGMVGAMLLQEGFKVRNMGGFKDWKAAGLPVQSFGSHKESD